MKELLISYFSAQTRDGTLALIVGVAALAVSGWLVAASHPFRGAAIPLALIAFVELWIGVSYLGMNGSLLPRLLDQLESSPAPVVNSELARIGPVLRNYRITVVVEALVLLAGTALALASRRDFAFAIGLGCIVQSAPLLIADLLGTRRTQVYLNALENLTPVARSKTMSKTILITGAGSGLGKLAALGLARKGHHVIATTHTWSPVTELKKLAEKERLPLRAEKLDVTSAIDRANAWKWDIDVLINNAAIMEVGPIAEQPIELLRSMFEVNLFANLQLTQGFAKKMVARRSGRIVFVSSMGGLITTPYGAGYCATKHALEAVAEGLKAELAPFGVKIATVNPGIFGTGFNDRGVDSMSHWYDPQANFTPPETFAGFADILAHQLDPQPMADIIVDVALSDNGRFRNVHPTETEEAIKQLQLAAWREMS